MLSRAVEHAMATYAQALDDRDWAVLDCVFASDIELSMDGGTALKGRASFVDTVRGYLDACGPTQHLLGQTIVETSNGGASSKTAFRAVHCDSTIATRVFEVIGRYHVNWTATTQGLRAVRWRYQLIAQFGDASILGRAVPQPGSSSD